MNHKLSAFVQKILWKESAIIKYLGHSLCKVYCFMFSLKKKKLRVEKLVKLEKNNLDEQIQ